MTEAAQRLLSHVFDYAGLFPPASLSMEDAVADYLKYRSGEEAWIMDRFVCTATMLDEFQTILRAQNGTPPVSISVVGSSGPEWEENLVHDAEAMTRFIERSGDAADIEAYEIRVPSGPKFTEKLQDLRAFNQVDVYCELGLDEDLAEHVGAIAETEWLRAKARTGGLEASQFPSSEAVALFLQNCLQTETPFKLTAGLHHPIRTYREEVTGKMHGFLNLLVASALSLEHGLSTRELVGIIDEERSSAFRFEAARINYGPHEVGLDTIEEMRELFIGIGSCSVEEPIADLQALKL